MRQGYQTRLVADEALNRARQAQSAAGGGGEVINNPTINGGTINNSTLNAVSLINPVIEGTSRYELFPIPGSPPLTEVDTDLFVGVTSSNVPLVLASIFIPDLTDFALDVKVVGKQAGAAIAGEWKLVDATSGPSSRPFSSATCAARTVLELHRPAGTRRSRSSGTTPRSS